MERPSFDPERSPAVFADPMARSHALVVGIVLTTALGFDHLGGRYLGEAGWEELPAIEQIVALEVVLIPLAIAALYMISQGRRWREYGLGRGLPWWRGGIAAIAGAGCLYILAPRMAMPVGLSFALLAAEELLRRGFLLNETAALLGGGRGGHAAAVTLLAGLASLGHLHTGVAAALATGGMELGLGALYLASGRSLWCVIAARALAEAASLAPLGG